FTGRVPLTPAGEAAAAAAAAAPNPGLRCEPIGIVMDWSYDSPVNRISQDERTITLESGNFDFARTIHLARTEHPADLGPGLTRQSHARWGNDARRAHPVGARPGRLTRGRGHGGALELTERFSPACDTLALTREFVAAGPLYLREPYTGADVGYPSNVPYQT